MASDPHRWRILAVVATAFFMTILDVSIVNVALPSIGKDLHFSQENLQWVITAYAIACDLVAVDGNATEEELRVLELIRHRLNIDRLIAAAIERGARARFQTL